MRVRISLIVLLLAGAAMVTLPVHFFGLPAEGDQFTMMNVWLKTLKLFAIPFCLLILGIARNPFATWLTVFYGFWMTSLTLVVIWGVNQGYYPVSPHGLFFPSTILVISLGLLFFSLIGGVTKPKKKSTTIEVTPVKKKSA